MKLRGMDPALIELMLEGCKRNDLCEINCSNNGNFHGCGADIAETTRYELNRSAHRARS